jgi:hypothetical protein
LDLTFLNLFLRKISSFTLETGWLSSERMDIISLLLLPLTLSIIYSPNPSVYIGSGVA